MTIIERRRFRQNHLRKELLRKMSAAVPCDPFQYVTDAAYAGLHQKYPDKDAALPAIERLEDELAAFADGRECRHILPSCINISAKNESSGHINFVWLRR